MSHPEKSYEDIQKLRAFQASFKGMHQCKLCPTKVINSDQALKNHIESKSHRNALAKYFKANERELNQRMFKIKQKVLRNVLFKTKKY